MALDAQLNALGRLRELDPQLSADIVLMLMAAPLGSILDLDTDQIERLAVAGCGVVVDAYPDD
ncbi:hypothetical protein [Enemella evansiae]|uniref:hypothetical protein n=1 Tax=Enemella evansiae TaxID=2016499 RepID=UPI0015C6635C|nr:hypothetical protein [Enemella evansiae]